MRRGVRLFYLHGDQLGSSTLVTDAEGTVTAETRYLPFGQRRWQLGDTPTDLGFTGQREERAFGLIDYNARYYNPRLGRFVSPDTIVPEQGDPQAYNRYAYVSNNPMKFVDPSGHCGSTTGSAFSACKNVVLTLAPAVHKANEYREAIFFPDAETTFADRLEASAAVGVGATVTAAATVYAATTAIPAAVSYVTPHVYSAHASWMTFAASRPFWAAVIGGAAKEIAESAITGESVDPTSVALSALTEGIETKAGAEPPGSIRFGSQTEPLGDRPVAPGTSYVNGKGRFFEYLNKYGSEDLRRYMDTRTSPSGTPAPWPSRKASENLGPDWWGSKVRNDFYRLHESYHSFPAARDDDFLGPANAGE